MSKARLLRSLSAGSVLCLAAFQASWAENIDADGFKNPLQQLQFNSQQDVFEFERATLDALHISDPLEQWNRRVYHFNYRFDQWVFLPAVRGYSTVTPHFIRKGVSNFFSNLGEIPTLANNILQLKGHRSMETTARILFNTILGIGGLWDPASKMGLIKHKEDFGQTLGFYGVPPGPYLMLPFLGPSNARDTGGIVADFSLDKAVDWMNMAETSRRNPEIYGLQIVDQRYITKLRYGQLNSPFEYEKIRYAYTKARELQIAE
ncbi:VacJ family lipoprotein [Denitrificimonas sp. JX-1]|uniref:VacJ family lipoprotein n=1 Tax=Denitrificimonas halotolerans TaxID=3098930 RepID=A0ABU5GR70_9GAMM|nr:VacJ family lipoprotein [Denitrificimonas sp. JX-1]MDY7218701.1 VacJ family lipoprotein [Denitrificimonas sp. JX-1]